MIDRLQIHLRQVSRFRFNRQGLPETHIPHFRITIENARGNINAVLAEGPLSLSFSQAKERVGKLLAGLEDLEQKHTAPQP